LELQEIESQGGRERDPGVLIGSYIDAIFHWATTVECITLHIYFTQ